MTQQAPPRASKPKIRRFTDCVGELWTVYSIAPQSMLESAIVLLPHEDRRQGWLLFESDAGERRRLHAFPEEWATVSDFELERWCMRAVPIGESPQRRAEDRPET